MNTAQDMEETLKRSDMGNDEKQKLYYANLERYLNLKHQKNNDLPTVDVSLKNTSPVDVGPIDETTRETLNDSIIVDSIPKSMGERAVSILNRLKTHPNMISWDKSRQVKLDSVDIQGSNISDLLSDAVRRRKNFNPVSSKEFFQVLSTMNIPRDLVRNEERWKQSLQLSSVDEEPHTSLQQLPVTDVNWVPDINY